MKLNKYTHGGSIWKNFNLFIHGLVNILAFGAIWSALLFWEMEWARMVLWVGGVLLILCVVFHIVLPLLRLFR